MQKYSNICEYFYWDISPPFLTTYIVIDNISKSTLWFIKIIKYYKK